jgi:hypothetical protein
MRELNWTPGQSAELSVLGDTAGAAPKGDPPKHPARILEYSGKRLRLAAEVSVKGGAAVRLEWDGQLLLGQVLHTVPGGFWMEIQHVLDTAGLNWQKQGWQRR